MTEIILDSLLDAALDTIKMLPFLLAAYLIIEYIEHKSQAKLTKLLSSGKYGVIGGAILGCIPQCGMSVAASNLFAKGIIGAGTLVAVIVSTSDEAIPIILAEPEKIYLIAPLLLTKVALGVILGLLLDTFYKRDVTKKLKHHTGCDHDHPELYHDFEDEHSPKHSEVENENCADHHDHSKHHDHSSDENYHHSCCSSCDDNIFIGALKRSLSILVFIFILNFALTFLIEWIGMDKISVYLMQNSFFQPVISALVGLIPNCAASVAITEFYLDGYLSFGSVIAGLCAGAGIGFVTLFKTNKNIKENLIVLIYVFAASSLAGIAIQFFQNLYIS